MDPGNSSNTASPRVALTQEEMRVLLQCNRDAFWQRSMPMMVAFGGSAHWLVRMGYLRSHPVRGSLYKILLGMGIGWFIGKASFRSECQRRILEQLPNSTLADTIRHRQVGPNQYQRPTQPGSPVIVPPPDKQDIGYNPQFGDNSSYSSSGEFREGRDAKVEAPTTYEDLRRRHHQDQQPARSAAPPPPQSPPKYDSPAAKRHQHVNKYGDVVED